MQTPPRMPMPTQPAEPGWWLAVDGRWYPPESAPASPAAQPAPTPVAVATGPQLGSPGGPVFHTRAAVPPLPPPNFQRPTGYAPAAAAYAASDARSSEAAAIVSLVLGIVSLVFSFWIMMALGFRIGIVVDLVLGTTSVLLGISARHNGAGGLAVAGITVGALSCSLSLLWILNVVMAIGRFGRI